MRECILTVLLISAGQVLTGVAGERVPDGAVLVDGSSIRAVGRREEIEAVAPEGVRRVSFPDATLLPGLINCHVHLAFDAGPDPVAGVQGADDVQLLAGMADRARQLLDCGVTTVRDLGDRDALVVRLRDAIADRALPGPRILAATAPLTTPGGHCWFLGGEVDGEPAIREMVRRNARRGADVIKVMVTGGALTPGGAPMWQSQFGVDEVRVVVEEARRAGLKVAAHAHGTEGIVSAVAAGVDTIEHCSWLANGFRFDVRDEVAAEMAAKGIAVCPAMSPNWRDFGARLGQEVAEELFGRWRWLADHGVRLIAGTDAGIPRSVFDDFAGSLELFGHLGFAPGRIIELATVDSAQALGIAARTGRLAPGLDADLLVVGGDPLTELTALRRVRLVLARGRSHVPAGFLAGG